jgi:Fur family peroxide stress response transcriptional regulator
MRYSVQRDFVYKALYARKDHPDAETLYEEVSRQLPRISRATVYKNLRELTEEGLVRQLDSCGSVKHYDAELYEHYHFVCRNCGRIEDLPGKTAEISLDFSSDWFASRTVDEKALVVYGKCENCS